jgi:thiosulfate dehydrogenase
MKRPIAAPILLLLAAAAVGGGVAALLANLVTFRTSAPPPAPATSAGQLAGMVVFDPPRPDDAPGDLRDAVLYGQRIMLETGVVLPDHVGNGLSCTNCHFDAGRARDTISLVGVAAAYPKYRSRTRYATDLVSRVNECFERSMNGKRIAPDGKEMQALVAYLAWISRGLPVLGDLPWLGLRHVKTNHSPDADAGRAVWGTKCAACHGPSGGGTRVAPAVWGDRSFNDGAGMSQPQNLATFGRLYMPKGAPELTVEQSVDVAAFITKQPRPHFGPPRDHR